MKKMLMVVVGVMVIGMMTGINLWIGSWNDYEGPEIETVLTTSNNETEVEEVETGREDVRIMTVTDDISDEEIVEYFNDTYVSKEYLEEIEFNGQKNRF